MSQWAKRRGGAPVLLAFSLSPFYPVFNSNHGMVLPHSSGWVFPRAEVSPGASSACLANAQAPLNLAEWGVEI